jgi:hypothetical protein
MSEPLPNSTPSTDTLCLGDALARRLSKLTPAPTDLLTPEMMFSAGQAVESRRTSFWKRLAVVQSLVIVGGVTAAALLLQPRPEAPPPTPPMTTPPSPVTRELAPEPREHNPTPMPHYPAAGFAVQTPMDLPIEERARWFGLRNDIMAGGVSMIPTPPSETRLPQPSGKVFAVPPTGSRPTVPPEEYP